MFVVRQLHFQLIYKAVVTPALTDQTLRHLSLVTAKWLIEISYVTVAYLFLT